MNKIPKGYIPVPIGGLMTKHTLYVTCGGKVLCIGNDAPMYIGKHRAGNQVPMWNPDKTECGNKIILDELT